VNVALSAAASNRLTFADRDRPIVKPGTQKCNVLIRNGNVLDGFGLLL
jgi:hypothetical protein